jgi:hypothetical protein
LQESFSCWHESTFSARSDPATSIWEEGLSIATARPVPAGTPIFLELSLGSADGAPLAEIDAIVIDGPGTGDESGFTVEFVEIAEETLAWIRSLTPENAGDEADGDAGDAGLDGLFDDVDLKSDGAIAAHEWPGWGTTTRRGARHSCAPFLGR